MKKTISGRKKWIVIVMIMVFFVLAAYLGSYTKITYAAGSNPSLESIEFTDSSDIANGHEIWQKITAEHANLDNIRLWFTDISKDTAGTLHVKIYSSDGALLQETTAPVSDFAEKSYGEVQLNIGLKKGETYYLYVSAVDAAGEVAICRYQAASQLQSFYDGAALTDSLLCDYYYQAAMNSAQKQMYILFCTLLFFTLLLLLIGKFCGLWKTEKSILGQCMVVLDLFAVFIATALVHVFRCSNLNVAPAKLVPAILFIVLAGALTCCYAGKNSRHFEPSVSLRVLGKKYSADIFLVLLITAMRIPFLGSFQRWDAGEYYYRLGTACKNFDFSIHSLFDYFRLCDHSCMGFSGLMSIGEFLSPRNALGVQIEILILSVLASYCVYILLLQRWKVSSKKVAFIITLVLSVVPIFYGTSSYVTPDYCMLLFFIFMLFCEYKRWYILLGLNAVLLSQSKETGVIILVFYILGILIRSVRIKKSARRIQLDGSVFLPVLTTALLAAACYVLNVVKVGSIFNWKAEDKTTVLNPKSNYFGLDIQYIILRLEQLFVSNFLWIMTLLLVLSIIILLLRKKKNGNLRDIVDLISAMVGFLLFDCFYVTACLNRYNVYFAVLYVLLVLLAIERVCSSHLYMTYGIYGVLGGLFIAQSFVPLDKVSNLAFRIMDTGNGSILYTSSDSDNPYCGDGLVNNYQYSWMDRALNKMLDQSEYDEDTEILLTSDDSLGIQIAGNPGVYQVGWNIETSKRQMSDETDSTNILEIQNEYSSDRLGVFPMEQSKYDQYTEFEKLGNRLVMPFLSYYNEDESLYQELMSPAYYVSEQQEASVVGGCLDYYILTKKDNCQGMSMADILDITTDKQTSEEAVEETLDTWWNQEALDDAIYAGTRGVSLWDEKSKTHVAIRQNDVVTVAIQVYTEAGDKLGPQYVGRFDGVEYAERRLTIGSGTAINGVEEALLGKKAGDEITIKVDIPENYTSIFPKNIGDSVTLKMVVVEILGESVDVCGSQEQYETVTTECYDDLWEVSKEQASADLLKSGYGLEISPEQKDVDRKLKYVQEYYNSYLSEMNMSKGDFCEILGVTEAEYDDLLSQMAELLTKKDVLEEQLETTHNILDIPDYNSDSTDNNTEEENSIYNYSLDDLVQYYSHENNEGVKDSRLLYEALHNADPEMLEQLQQWLGSIEYDSENIIPNTDFVAWCYRTFLHRQCSEGERYFWGFRLADGRISRYDLVKSLVVSQEFEDSCMAK